MATLREQFTYLIAIVVRFGDSTGSITKEEEWVLSVWLRIAKPFSAPICLRSRTPEELALVGVLSPSPCSPTD